MSCKQLFISLTCLAAVSLLGMTQSSARADDKVRVDADGFPLPPGAVMRLGSLRMKHRSGVEAVAFRKDADYFASIGRDGVLRHWEVATGKRRNEFPIPVPNTGVAVFSRDGGRLAVRASKDLVQLWNVDTGEQEHSLPIKNGDLRCIALSPDARVLAAYDKSNWSIRIWRDAESETRDAPTLQTVENLYIRRLKPVSLRFSGDAERLLAVNEAGRVGVVDVESGTIEFLRIPDLRAKGGVVAVSPDGASFAAATNGGVAIWNTAHGARLREFKIEPDKRVSFEVGSLQFSPSAQSLVATLRYDAIPLVLPRDMRKYKRNEDLRKLVTCTAVSVDGGLLATGTGQGVVRLWNLENRKELHRPEHGHQNTIHCVAFSPHNGELISGAFDGTARFWNTNTGAENKVFRHRFSAVESAVWSPDARSVLLALGNAGAVLIDANSLKVRHELPVPNAWEAAFSTDGKSMALASRAPVVRQPYIVPATDVPRRRSNRKSTRVRRRGSTSDELYGGRRTPQPGDVVSVFSVESGRLQNFHQLPDDSNHVSEIAFAPHEAQLAVASCDDRVLLINPDGTTQSVTVTSGGSRADRVIFLAPGAVAIGTNGHGLEVWELEPPRKLAELTGREAAIIDLAVTADRSLLASIDKAGRICVWDVALAVKLAEFQTAPGNAVTVDVTADGSYVATGGPDHTTILWDVEKRLFDDANPTVEPAAVETLWEQLGSTDAVTAHRAIQQLVKQGGDVVPFFKQQYAGLRDQNSETLIADLGNDQFSIRAQAQRKLSLLNHHGRPLLERVIKETDSPEVKRRASRVLKGLNSPLIESPEVRRLCRGIKVLEQLTDDESGELLRNLRNGRIESRLTARATTTATVRFTR